MQDTHIDVIEHSLSVRSAVHDSVQVLQERVQAYRADMQDLLAIGRTAVENSRALLGRHLAGGHDDGTSPGRPQPPDPQPAAMERLRLLEAVVAQANDAVLITEAGPVDFAGSRILSCNAAFTRMTGYGEDELRGRTSRILQGPGTDRTVLDRLRRHRPSRHPFTVELLNYRKDGTPFRVELSLVPLLDADGAQTHWISLQRDVGDRSAAAEAARREDLADHERRGLRTEIEEHKQVERRLFQAAFHDDLTHLHNRAFLLGHLASLLGQAHADNPLRWALLFLDLNRFKFVNDTLGHTVGDQLLVEVAGRLRLCVAEDDVVARMGGDEFALLVDVSDGIEPAVLLAERIAAAFLVAFQLGDHAVRVSCSIGIAALTPEHQEPEAVLRDADIAMYRAKKAGSREAALFTAKADADAVLALVLQSDLLLAMERGEFRLLYQPIFTAERAYPCSFEALIRWHHPTRGLISPNVFIPLAEVCGVARAIGRWVLDTALGDLVGWIRRFPEAVVRLNLNVSPNELLDERFVHEVVGAMKAAGLPPYSLELEITEAVFQDRSPHVLETLRRLRLAGIRLALDDFGTGYSSLGSIDSYPIDTLKIDRTFVIGMLERPRTRALVEMIITLAKALELDIVAEGVETEAQFQALIAMGCHHFQGYHLSRPLRFADAMQASRTDPA